MSDKPDTAETPVRPPRRFNRLKIALVISLALNLLILGLVLGAMSHRWRDPDMRQDRALADLGFSPYVAALDPEDRRDLGREMIKRAGDFRRNREEIQAEFASIIAILRAPDFDAQAFRAGLMSQGAKLQQRRASGVDLFVAELSGMELEKRTAIADRLERMIKRFRP